MNDPRPIRPSDRLAPEHYPEWLQLEAEAHEARRFAIGLRNGLLISIPFWLAIGAAVAWLV